MDKCGGDCPKRQPYELQKGVHLNQGQYDFIQLYHTYYKYIESRGVCSFNFDIFMLIRHNRHYTILNFWELQMGKIVT